MTIKKGDRVKIRSGKDRGKTGIVLKFSPEKNLAAVEGLNLVRKRTRPRQQGKKGETVLVPRPLPLSRVMLICGSCKRAVRTGFRFENEKKVRYCKRCQAVT